MSESTAMDGPSSSKLPPAPSEPPQGSHSEEGSSSSLPVDPTLVQTSPENYGALNAEDQNSLYFVPSVPDEGVRRYRKGAIGKIAGARTATHSSSNKQLSKKMAPGNRDDRVVEELFTSGSPATGTSPLLALPAELIDAIFSYLSPYYLTVVGTTCRKLRHHATSDVHWHELVQQNVPCVTVSSPGPCSSFQEVYVAHDRLWFLPKYKIWFSDRDLMGKIILVRYDPRRACIEGFQLVAAKKIASNHNWLANQQVVVHGFNPSVSLHLDKPVLQFRVGDREEDGSFSTRDGANRFTDELPMAINERLIGMHNNFILTRPLDPELADEHLVSGYPYGHVWPPPTIPAHHYVSGSRAGEDGGHLPDDRPWCRSQVSDQTFRTRQWLEMGGSPNTPRLDGRFQTVAGLNSTGVRLGEEISTFSTLDPALYTPTATKPWRGIWVGDYSGYGCEFLLINQPDDPPTTDAELGLTRRQMETADEWEQRRIDARVNRGRLEAIKLTGDPNVPRGEYTFVADDLGPNGLIGVAEDAPFAGARIVRSMGHIAHTGFVNDKFIESQLLLIDKDHLAQYWVGFGHISCFERVDIDSLLIP